MPDLVMGADGRRVPPVGVHVVGMSAVIAHLVTNRPDENHRAQLAKDLLDYVKLMRDLGLHVERVLVDGSFTSDKMYPRDIDCSPIVDGSLSKPIPEILNTVTSCWVSPRDRYKTTPVPWLERTVGLDVYGFVQIPTSHPNHNLGLEAERYWKNWWQLERQGAGTPSKGCLEVIIDE
ncbi:DUF6932 family protein [Zhihengliuella halotolerans]|nr:hypothetical protein [Zhihengliuella halotolerans]